METLEHRRFAEFCDACGRYGYIGLCYGSPGVGKTLSARHYSGWNKFNQTDRFHLETCDGSILNTVFYTPAVVNTPGIIGSDIHRARADLLELAKQALLREKIERLDFIRRRDEEHQRTAILASDWLNGEKVPKLQPTFPLEGVYGPDGNGGSVDVLWRESYGNGENQGYAFAVENCWPVSPLANCLQCSTI